MAPEILSSVETVSAAPEVLRPASPFRFARPDHALYDRSKEWVDRLGALLFLIALSPFLLMVALLIVMDSPGSPLYTQWRRGRDQKSFRIFKFRTMEKDAHHKRKSLFHRSHADGIIFKMKEDPRTTRIGKYLRKYSIDEFPQLLNVLRGEMSLVGPRPFSEEVFQRPYEHAMYDLWLAERHRVPPGMTGMWQVSGRNNLPFDKLMRLDLLYVYFRSARLDLTLLARTFRAVIGRRGAY